MASDIQRYHLILDFDGTIIKNNTIPLLDYLRHDRKDISYSSFLEPYLQDYAKHVKAYQPSQEERLSLQQEYDYLDSLYNIERRSIERIEASEWLKGLRWAPEDHSEFDRAVSSIRYNEDLIWREGFTDLIQAVWKDNGIVDILSVNWSGNFIRALLRHEFGESIDVNKINIYANEIDPSGTGHFSRIYWEIPDHFTNHWSNEHDQDSGKIRGIWTAQDKALIMRTITAKSKADNMVVIYAGDSKTDLKSIMEADMGICIVDDTDPSAEQISLKRVLDRLNIPQVSLKTAYFEEPKDKGGFVYRANDFNDVHEALLNNIR